MKETSKMSPTIKIKDGGRVRGSRRGVVVWQIWLIKKRD